MENKPTSDDIFAILMRDARISFDELRRHPHARFSGPAVSSRQRAGWQGRLEVGAGEMMEELARLAERAANAGELADYPRA